MGQRVEEAAEVNRLTWWLHRGLRTPAGGSNRPIRGAVKQRRTRSRVLGRGRSLR